VFGGKRVFDMVGNKRLMFGVVAEPYKVTISYRKKKKKKQENRIPIMPVSVFQSPVSVVGPAEKNSGSGTGGVKLGSLLKAVLSGLLVDSQKIDALEKKFTATDQKSADRFTQRWKEFDSGQHSVFKDQSEEAYEALRWYYDRSRTNSESEHGQKVLQFVSNFWWRLQKASNVTEAGENSSLSVAQPSERAHASVQTGKKRKSASKTVLSILTLKKAFVENVRFQFQTLGPSQELLRTEVNQLRMSKKLMFRETIGLGFLGDVGVLRPPPESDSNVNVRAGVPALFQYPFVPYSSTMWQRKTAAISQQLGPFYVLYAPSTAPGTPEPSDLLSALQVAEVVSLNSANHTAVIRVATGSGEFSTRTVQANRILPNLRMCPFPDLKLEQPNESAAVKRNRMWAQMLQQNDDASSNWGVEQVPVEKVWRCLVPFALEVLGFCQFVAFFDCFGPAFNLLQASLASSKLATPARSALQGLSSHGQRLNVALYVLGDVALKPSDHARFANSEPGSAVATEANNGSESKHDDPAATERAETGSENARIRAAAFRSRASGTDAGLPQCRRPGKMVDRPKDDKTKNPQRFTHMRSVLMFYMDALIGSVEFLRKVLPLAVTERYVGDRKAVAGFLEYVVSVLKVSVGKNFDVSRETHQKQKHLQAQVPASFQQAIKSARGSASRSLQDLPSLKVFKRAVQSAFFDVADQEPHGVRKVVKVLSGKPSGALNPGQGADVSADIKEATLSSDSANSMHSEFERPLNDGREGKVVAEKLTHQFEEFSKICCNLSLSSDSCSFSSDMFAFLQTVWRTYAADSDVEFLQAQNEISSQIENAVALLAQTRM